MYCVSSIRIRGQREDEEARMSEESSVLLVLLVVAKNEAHMKALQSNTATDRKESMKHQRVVKKAMEKARVDWICRVAREEEAAVNDGRARCMGKY